MNLPQPNLSLIKKITDYQTLLNTDEWKNHRKSIIKRDGFCCKKCGKSQSVPHLKYNISFQMNDKLILDSISCESKSFNLIKSELKINTISIISNPDVENLFFGIGENGILFLVDFNLIKNLPVEQFICYYGETELGEKFKIIGTKQMNFKEIDLGIPKIVKEPLFLHAHHLFYDLEKLPWEYEDIALITLCDQCHSDVHDNDEFKIYTTVNSELREILLKLCIRCKGSGFLPQYSHVENGICFRCRGAKFEELIHKYQSSN